MNRMRAAAWPVGMVTALLGACSPTEPDPPAFVIDEDFVIQTDSTQYHLRDDGTYYRLTLEVRVSNESAQALYHKYGFTRQGVRRRYYSDNGEDAHIMTTEDVDTPRFQQVLAANRRALRERLVVDE